MLFRYVIILFSVDGSLGASFANKNVFIELIWSIADEEEEELLIVDEV